MKASTLSNAFRAMVPRFGRSTNRRRLTPSQEARLARAVVEALEPRQLLSCSLSNGLLTVNGSSGSDFIQVYRQTSPSDIINARINSVDCSGSGFTTSQVTRIDVYGGAGHDFIVIESNSGWGLSQGDVPVNKPTHIFGEAGFDDILGGDMNDLISGGDDGDTLRGFDGLDTIWGGSGNDIIHGGDDNDDLQGHAGNDTITGGDGDDVIAGDLSGGSGNDSLEGGEGADFIYGGPGDDVVKGDAGNDTLRGDEDDDIIYGGDGNDLMYGNDGSDTLYGGPGADIQYGGAGNDFFHSPTDGVADLLVGGDGTDTILDWDYTEGDGEESIEIFP